MTTIVHLSDTHFGTEVADVVIAAGTAVERIKPDIIILSGDITQRARPSQFKAAQAFLSALPAEVKLVIPGNHDLPLHNLFMRFSSPYRNYRDAFGARESFWCNEEVGVLCCDATSPFRHTRGRLPYKRTARLLQSLKRHLNPSAVLIACAHQPLVTAWPEDRHETLIGRAHTAELWSENRVDIGLSGHVHVPLLTTTHTTFPALPRHFVLAGAGTAVSWRTRPGAPNSFNVIKTGVVDGNKFIAVAPHVFDGETSRFEPGAEIRYRETASGWSA